MPPLLRGSSSSGSSLRRARSTQPAHPSRHTCTAFSSDAKTSLLAPRGTAALPVSRLRTDLCEDRLEQLERGEHVLARERPCAGRTPRHQGLLDRAVLLGVLQVETVDRVIARSPNGGPRERAARALRELLDERKVGDAVDHVVEPVIRAHPVAHDRAALLPGLERPQTL